MDYMDYEDERLMELEQRRAQQRIAERDASQLGLVGMALLPFSVAASMLIETLKLVLEKRSEMAQTKAEAKCLEELIMDATARTQPGQIVPLEELLRGNEHGRDAYR